MIVSEVDVWRLQVPLRVPYKLAFGEIRAYDTVLIRIRASDGSVGLGEATLLAGYSEETVADSWSVSTKIAPEIIGKDFSTAREAIDRYYPSWPFSVCAFTTALEAIENHAQLQVATTERVPILGLVGGHTEAEIGASIDQALAKGYSTLKVKVGFEVKSDLAHVETVQRLLAGRGQIRIDANQGFTVEEGKWFASHLNPQDIELFEQPCGTDEWAGAQEIARVATVPMMLDESILSLDDIARSAELKAARFIKLKLMKVGGLSRLTKALDYIRAHEMEPVLGNGVAGDIGCWMEACVASKMVSTTGEMNGSLKPTRSLLKNPLTITDGHVVLEPGYAPELDLDAVKAVTLETSAYAG